MRWLLLLLCACEGWDPTPEAVARRVGGAQVESCILAHGGRDHGGCDWKDYCLDLVEHGYCTDAGVPLCSRNEPESLCSP
jgi:hypothetical protein